MQSALNQQNAKLLGGHTLVARDQSPHPCYGAATNTDSKREKIRGAILEKRNFNGDAVLLVEHSAQG